jgi:hypothetical protein
MIPSVNGFTGAVEPVESRAKTGSRGSRPCAHTLREGNGRRPARCAPGAFLSRSSARRSQPDAGEARAVPGTPPSVPTQVSSSPADGRALQNQQGSASQAAAASVPAAEKVLIRDAASRAAVDPRFLGALRRAENGGPGREFGVLSVSAPTYENQVRLAAASIRRNVERFEATGRGGHRPSHWPVLGGVHPLLFEPLRAGRRGQRPERFEPAPRPQPAPSLRAGRVHQRLAREFRARLPRVGGG